MSQPFNEDHPDFESYVKGISDGVDDEERVIRMMQLACPVDMLFHLLHDEIRGVQNQMKGVALVGVLALMWFVWPVLTIALSLDLPLWTVLATGSLSVVTGIAFGWQFASFRPRWQRYRGFIRPAHQALHHVMDHSE